MGIYFSAYERRIRLIKRGVVMEAKEWIDELQSHPDLSTTYIDWEAVDEIEDIFKALKIIKEKTVDISWFYYSDNVNKYNSIMEDSRRYLTHYEYEVLTKVLLWVKD